MKRSTMKLLSVLLLLTLSFGCGGYSSSSGMQPPTTPGISTLSPPDASAGASDVALMVNGTGFANNSVIYWNSVAVATAFVSAQQLTTTIPAADVTTAGTVMVYVKNPGTGVYAMGVNSNSVSFVIH
jgi:hypothetical protein